MKPPAPRRPGPSAPQPSASDSERSSRSELSRPAASPARERDLSASDARASREVARSSRVASFKGLIRPIGQADAAAVLGPVAELTDFVKRREERLRAKRSFVVKTALIAFLGVLVLAGVLWVVFFSSLFALDSRRVEVEGTQPGVISEEEVRAAVAPFEGIPLSRLSLGAIESQIAQLRPVSSVQVKRHWPTGLDIALSVRVPAMIEGSEGAYRLVDAEGVSFAPADPLPEGVPYVVLPDEEGARRAAAEDVRAVWEACPDSVKARIGWISADGATVSFTLDTGATVKWGTAQDSALKARVVEVLIAQREASVYDVSAPAHPVIS